MKIMSCPFQEESLEKLSFHIRLGFNDVQLINDVDGVPMEASH